MKQIATMALMLYLGVAGLYVQKSVDMCASAARPNPVTRALISSISMALLSDPARYWRPPPSWILERVPK
jgi:hypothetical protein